MSDLHLEPVEVTARFDPAGRVYPLSLVHDGRSYPIDDVGRRWSDSDGLHILVMLPGLRAVELIYRAVESRWYLQNRPSRTGFA